VFILIPVDFLNFAPFRRAISVQDQ